LKNENETLEAEKARMSEELKDFSSTRQEVEALRKERDSLEIVAACLKEKEEVEAEAIILRKNASEAGRARGLAVQRAEKADDIADCLRKELDAERASAAAIQTHLQEVEAEAAAVIGLYSGLLAQFGGSTSALLTAAMSELAWHG